MPLFNSLKNAFARERVTVGATAIVLSSDVYRDVAAASNVRGPATGAKITVEAGSIRYCETGEAPVTTSKGTVCPVGGQIVLESYQAIAKFQAIQESGAAAIEVVYYK